MDAKKRLCMIQGRREYCYRAYQKGEIDQKEYLSRIYPLDIAIEHLEISILLQQLSNYIQKRKK
jgi:hypothetical protein